MKHVTVIVLAANLLAQPLLAQDICTPNKDGFYTKACLTHTSKYSWDSGYNQGKEEGSKTACNIPLGYQAVGIASTTMPSSDGLFIVPTGPAGSTFRVLDPAQIMGAATPEETLEEIMRGVVRDEIGAIDWSEVER